MNESGRTFAKWWMKEEKRKRSVGSWKKTVSGLTQETDDLCRNAQRCLDSGLDKKDAEGWREFVADPNEALSIGFLVSENGEKIRGYGVEIGPCTIVVPFPSDGGGFVWPDDDDLPAFFALLAQSLRPFSAAFSLWRTSAIRKGGEGTEKRAEEREKTRNRVRLQPERENSICQEPEISRRRGI